MTKTIEPGAMFHLPTLTLGGTLALASKLLAAAKAEKKLPADLAKTTKRMRQAHDAMARAKRDRVRAQPDRKARARVRSEEVAAWGALHRLLDAWSSLPGVTQAADRLRSALLTGDPPFARRRFEVAWKEADERLKLIAEEKLEDAIEAIGAAIFIENIERAHRASGAHLGITQRQALSQDALPTIKRLAEELRTIMREYVVQAAGHAVGDRKAKALANRLLAPIGEWREVRKSRKRAAPEVAPTAAPAEPPPAVPETNDDPKPVV